MDSDLKHGFKAVDAVSCGLDPLFFYCREIEEK